MSTVETWLLNYAVNSLWQVPLVFAAAWLAARASRRAGPAFQHALWTSALVAEVLLPACTARPGEAWQILLQWLRSLHPGSSPAGAHVTITMGPVHVAGGFQLPPTLLTAAAIVYLAGLFYFATRLAIGLHQTASLRRRAEPLALTGHARESYHRFAQLFAVHDAFLAASTEIAGPITLGILRPTLLLPAQLDTDLHGEDLDAALAHEFAHMRRRDFAKNLLYEVLSLPIAFHPLLRITRSRMAETRELVCDAMAAEVVAGRQRYARSLLRLATRFSEQTHAPAPHAIGIFDAHPFQNFERRVMNLTHHSLELKGAGRLAAAALSLLLIGGACTSALAFRMQVAAPQAPTTTTPILSLAIPRAGESARSYQLEIPNAPAGTNALPAGSYVLKVLPPTTGGPSQASSDRTLQVSPGVIAGNRITFVAPVYPPDAKAAKLSGVVLLHAVIGKDGTITNLSVISGPDAFRESALTAVKQWVYKPYLLNGEPTTVDTTITINYALDPSATPAAPEAPNPSGSNASQNLIDPASALGSVAPPPTQVAAGTNQAMHIGGNVKPPMVVSQVEPEYSQRARAAKISGNVEVYLWVETNGHPSHIRVVKGVGMGLDERAVEAVRQYRFKPATLDGKPVPVDLYIDVNFAML